MLQLMQINKSDHFLATTFLQKGLEKAYYDLPWPAMNHVKKVMQICCPFNDELPSIKYLESVCYRCLSVFSLSV